MHKNKEIVLNAFGASENRLDAHMHLAWVSNLADYLRELQQSNLHVFANTVSAEEFLNLREKLASTDWKNVDLHDSSVFVCPKSNLKMMSDLRGEACDCGLLRDEKQSKNLQRKSDLKFIYSAAEQAKSDFKYMSDFKFDSFSNVRIGVGAHPWFTHKFKSDLFCNCFSKTQFVGEIGLDFSKRFSEREKEQQIKVFRTVCSSCASSDDFRILSVHSCKTNGLTHEILKSSGCLNNCVVIYHWFNDDFETLSRCKKDGCLFSVNPRMLATKKGAEIARQIGTDQLLLETDLPRREDETLAAADELEAIIQLWEKLIKTENVM